MSTIYVFKDKVAYHPGYYVKEIMDANHMTMQATAKQMGVSEKALEDIVKGNRSVSKATAARLECVFGASEKFWLNIQKEYDDMVEAKEKEDQKTLKRATRSTERFFGSC